MSKILPITQAAIIVTERIDTIERVKVQFGKNFRFITEFLR